MPRHKSSVPQRLSEEQRQSEHWQMGEQLGQQESESETLRQLLINDDDDYVSEDDLDYQPPDASVNSKRQVYSTRKKKNRDPSQNEVEITDDILLTFIDGAKFYIPVTILSPEPDIMTSPSTSKASSHEWKETLAELEFSLHPVHNDSQLWPISHEKYAKNETDFWIYVSDVELRSIVYFEVCGKPEYFVLSAIPDLRLLEGFIRRGKKQFFSLKYDLSQNNNPLEKCSFKVSVVVNESNLVKLNHPSDAVVKIPVPVIRTLNALLLKTDLDSVPDDEFENQDGPVSKPDIDKLYESIRRYHEDMGHTNTKEVDDFSLNPQHRSLLPKLRPYQINAVRWMVSRESETLNQDENRLHPLYEEVKSMSGSLIYFNRVAGYILRHRPPAQRSPPGGILADEMGLGKTVEILSLILCHPRPNVSKPEWKDPVLVRTEKKKKRRRARSPSPVEFRIEETSANDSELQESNPLLQVDGNQTSEREEDSTEDSDEIYTPPSASVAKRAKVVRKKPNESSLVDFEESTDNESDFDEDYSPPTTSRVGFSRAKTRARTFEMSDSDEDEKLVERWKKSARKSKPKAKKEKSDETIIAPNAEFDPKSVLGNRVVNKKSKVSDMILYIVANNQKNSDGVSAVAIKKLLDTEFDKRNNKHINSELIDLVSRGLLLNSSGLKGATGSFIVNPDFDNFDSRRLFLNKPDLDNVSKIIEQVITKFCYDGKSCTDEKSSTQIEIEQRVSEKKKKSNSVYDKLRKIYEQEMAEMSEVFALRDERRKKWKGQFFETKVAQCDYFECICGSELDESHDPKHRVQCSSCRLWQHSECVKYDVTDPYRGEFYCPHCWMERDPVESGATLIITPNTISHQWLEEIQKHIHKTNLRMLFYKGTKACGYIQPRTLASYDLVITTYGVLQSETNYVDLPHTNSSEGRRFRNPKRFMAIPAPLPCINWWRICLDEAQMIENSTTKTAEMALRLKAVNRWCVTGTPIGKSLNDLQGLMLFLQVDPYCLEFWWQRCLCRPYLSGRSAPLENVLSEIMWRTSKKDVLNQINIPKQTEEIHWLTFSPIEEHFYRRTFADCSREMIDKFRNFPRLDMTLSQMDRKSLQTLLNPLLRLRQSCCHPQAVRGQFIKLNKSTMTMEDLLEQMIKKATLECEDSNRAFISSLNGLAGIDIIEEKWNDAAEKYREVLRFVDENKDRIKTDTLQRLHTIVNLKELLEANHDGIAPTLRDDQLNLETEELRQKYLKKYSNALEAALGAVQPVTANVESLRESFLCFASSKAKKDEGSWYVQTINSANTPTHEENLLKLVHEEMAQFYDVVNNREFEQIRARYCNTRMILYKIAEKIDEIDNMRDTVLKELSRFRMNTADHYLNSAVDCHLRMSNVVQKSKKKCELCSVHDSIEVYESLLFHFVKGEIKMFQNDARQSISAEETKRLEDAGVYLHEDQRKGTWADSEVERLLRAVLKYIRQSSVSSSHEIREDGSTHMKLFDAMKKEFRLLRIFWRQFYDQVAAVDELNMSVMRLRLRYDDEPVTSQAALKRKKTETGPNLATREKDKFETIYILEPHEIGSQRLKLNSDRTVAINEFRKRFGQLLYLENLRKSDYGKHGTGGNPEPCPICQKSLGTQWSVLQCGHCFCVECIKILIEEYSVRGIRSSVKCAICRNLTYHSDVSYVNTVREHESEADSKAYEAIKGSLSTKIEAVVKTLIRIQMLDPEAKSLVFSTWADVLDILGSALTENNIPFAALQDQGKFKRNLEKFKVLS